jgi:hypothetical protein
VRPAKFSCCSLLSDGNYVVTTDHDWKVTPNPGDRREQLVGAPPGAVVARHRACLGGLRPVAVRAEGLAEAILAREQRYVDRMIERGVYVPMTGEEIERVSWKG